ncbi:MAG: GNAT family N-acetyltransferase [Victivallales bacterium]|nr:GNAT family N-acetyltransferase [Victivallales bacterium]
MVEIWNEVIAAGNAFPQREPLRLEQANEFFGSQSYTGVAEDDGKILGLYILHPNNIGRVGKLANASYAVTGKSRGYHVGEALVRDSLERGRELGFRALQFNAVVASNTVAIRLYEKLDFQRLGRIPRIFERPDGTFEDILLFYHPL